ncbi:MAG: glucosamine-6-phosphate deaminase [Verrucomicrobiota bacterium]
MNVSVFGSPEEMGKQAAESGAKALGIALAERDEAFMIVATGSSQFQMLKNLIEASLPWQRVTGFHLDEYIGLPIEHKASFRAYLWKRFVSRLPLPLAAFHFLNGELDPETECRRVAESIQAIEVDVAFVGIGENGHLAFNDPPADFDTEAPYLVVELDDQCRQQQFGEGWFDSFESVPTHAISMSVRQILKSKTIICTVPDERKAKAVREAVKGPVTSELPASILQTHPNCHLFLDQASASLL